MSTADQSLLRHPSLHPKNCKIVLCEKKSLYGDKEIKKTSGERGVIKKSRA